MDTFHGFCAKFLESQGEALDFSTMQDNPGFWREVQERVIAEAIPDAWRFDTLIVDEDQDFAPGWYDILGLFLNEENDVLWLEDEEQNLYGQPSVPLEDFVGYRANVNYRSPESIYRFIRKTLPFEFEGGNDLPGLGVGVHGYDDPGEQPALAARVVKELLKRGFTYDDIVILTCRGFRNSIFSERKKVGNMPLRRFTGEYDLFGNQVLTEGRLTFDSVYRFKGQEAPTVVLVDVDPDPDRLEHARRWLYCGMSRATVRLEMLVNETNPECGGFLQA